MGEMRGCNARKSLYPQRPEQLLVKSCSGGTPPKLASFQGLPRLCPGRSPYSYGDAKTPRRLSGSPEPPLSVPWRGGWAAGTRGGELSRCPPPLLLAPLPVSRGLLLLLLAALRAPAATWGRRRQRRGRGRSAPSGAVPSPYPGAGRLGGLWGSPATPRPCLHLHGSPRSSSGAQVRLHPLEMPSGRAGGLGVTSKSKFSSRSGILFG